MALSSRSALRQFILAACEADQYVKLEAPASVRYEEYGGYDHVAGKPLFYDRVAEIVEVGRFRKATKLVDRFGNLFSLNEVTEEECSAILAKLNTRCPVAYTFKS